MVGHQVTVWGEVSRLQFELHRVGMNAWIEDKSMNGTCANGIKLGTEDHHCIYQGHVIPILQKDFKVFYFMSDERRCINFLS